MNYRRRGDLQRDDDERNFPLLFRIVGCLAMTEVATRTDRQASDNPKQKRALAVSGTTLANVAFGSAELARPLKCCNIASSALGLRPNCPTSGIGMALHSKSRISASVETVIFESLFKFLRVPVFPPAGKRPGPLSP